MIRDLICSVKELEALRQLHANAAQAQREFQIAFTQSCFMRDIGDATFTGLTPTGLLIETPDAPPDTEDNA